MLPPTFVRCFSKKISVVTTICLKVGQALQLHNGTTVVINEIDTSSRVEKVYNLTVANTHNYFVGGDGVLVHNCGLIDEKRAKHIFRDKEGHLPDTPENRTLSTEA